MPRAGECDRTLRIGADSAIRRARCGRHRHAARGRPDYNTPGADNAICTAFAAAQAAVHDPVLMQPGLADRIRADFATAGYHLAVAGHTAIPALIETYPHPIMMQLCRSPRRVPYKAGKTRHTGPNWT